MAQDRDDPRDVAERTFRDRLAPLLALADEHPEATDLCVDHDTVRLDLGDRWLERPMADFPGMGPTALRAAASAAAVYAGAEFGPRHPAEPVISVKLPPDLRVTVVQPPMGDHWHFAIRFLRSRGITLDRYVEQGVMTKDDVHRIRKFLEWRFTMVISGMTGSGKAQPVDEPVLTPTGWRPIGDLQPGDPVLGPDGRVALVRGVFRRGVLPVLRFRFRDGRTARCSTDHLWQVWAPTSVRIDGVRAATWRWAVRPASAIAATVSTGSQSARRAGIPLISPDGIGGSPIALPIPPYALGVLLGDGSLSTGLTPRVMKPDRDVIDRFAASLAPIGYALRPVTGAAHEYACVAVDPRSGSLSRLLRTLGLAGLRSHEKFIPFPYLDAPPVDRLELLRGLLDTDGTVGLAGGLSFASSSRRLAEGVQRLVWSLGGIATIATKAAPRYSYRGETRTGKPAHVVSISHTNAHELLTLPRKADRLLGSLRQRGIRSDLRLQITSVEPDGEAECVCIAVDRPDGLYVTRDFVVTHNTTLLRALLEEIAQTERLVILEDTPELVVRGRNVVHLQTTRGQDLAHLVQVALRLRPDRIVVGEVRGAEALEFLRAANTGHAGSLCTLHSNGGPDALERLHGLAIEGQPGYPFGSVVSAVHWVLHLAGRGPDRKLRPPWQVPDDWGGTGGRRGVNHGGGAPAAAGGAARR